MRKKNLIEIDHNVPREFKAIKSRKLFITSFFVSFSLSLLVLWKIASFVEFEIKKVSIANILDNNVLTFQNFKNYIEKYPLELSHNSITITIAITISFFITAIIVHNIMITPSKTAYKNIEKGSARWGTEKDIAPFIDKAVGKPYYYNNNNTIFTMHTGLSLNARKTYRNNNVLVIGGSGSGKTRFWVKPNIMQMNASYIVTDPKGEILRETGEMLQKHGYDVRVFNLTDPEHSSFYNPFVYIENEKDILNVVNTIMASTQKSTGSVSNEDFWENAAKALLMSVFGYVHYELPPEEQNVATVMDLLETIKIEENAGMFGGGGQKSIFEKLIEQLPDEHFAKKQFKVFQMGGASKTTQSVLITAGVRLAPWTMKPIRYLMQEDTINLRTIGDKKTALFIIIPDSAKDFNFIAAIMYQQLFYILYRRADYFYKGSLPIHVRFILDEFANIGGIPDFDKYLATMRSRNISAAVIIQNISQLKALYKKEGESGWEKIVGNTDSILFLGGQEESTLKYVSQRLGKTTLVLNDISHKEGMNDHTSYSYRYDSRDLMMQDELARMPYNKCVYMLKGVPPFYDDKFDIKAHPHYNELAEVTGRTYLPEEIPVRTANNILLK